MVFQKSNDGNEESEVIDRDQVIPLPDLEIKVRDTIPRKEPPSRLIIKQSVLKLIDLFISHYSVRAYVVFFIFLFKYIALTLFFCPKSWTLTGKEAEALHLEEEDDEDHEEEKDPIQKMLKSKMTN